MRCPPPNLANQDKDRIQTIGAKKKTRSAMGVLLLLLQPTWAKDVRVNEYQFRHQPQPSRVGAGAETSYLTQDVPRLPCSVRVDCYLPWGVFPAILELRQLNNSQTQGRRIADVVGHPTQVLDVSPRFATESNGEQTLFPHRRNSS